MRNQPIANGKIPASNSTTTPLLFSVQNSRKQSQPGRLPTTQQALQCQQQSQSQTQDLTWFGLSLHPQTDRPHWDALTELKSVLEAQLLTEAQVLH